MRNITWRQLTVVALLATFMAINFADKAVIGLAGPHIMKDLALRPAEFGFVGSSFFLLFSVSGLVIGFVANKVKSYYIIAGLALVWAIAQFPVALFASFPILLMSRVLLGAGEGPAFPMSMHAAYKWFPDEQRNVPTAIVQQGVNVGLMVAGPLLTFVIVTFGWHSAFLFLGILGLLWAAAWLLFGGEGTVNEQPGSGASHHAVPAAAHVPLPTLLFDGTSLSLILIYFVEYSGIALFFTWLPSYLRLGLQFSEAETGWLFAAISGSWIPLNLVLAEVSRRLAAAGCSSRIARGIFCSVMAGIGGLLFMMLSLQIGPVTKVFVLAIGGMLAQTIFIFGPLIFGEICPKNQRGGLFGIFSSIGTLGGIIAPFVMGYIVQGASSGSAAGYQNGYFVLGALLVAVGILGTLFVDPGRSVARFAEVAQRPSARSELSLLHPVGKV